MVLQLSLLCEKSRAITPSASRSYGRLAGSQTKYRFKIFLPIALLGFSQRLLKECCYHSVANAFWLVFSYCEVCCGGAKKLDAMFFVSIPTIKYYCT